MRPRRNGEPARGLGLASQNTDRPLVTIVTASSKPGAAANNECRWLETAFREMDVRADAVYLEGPAGVSGEGSTRTVRLGTVTARGSVRALARYLRDSKPGVTIVWPSHIGPFAVAAGVLARQPVVPWEVTLLSHDLGHGSDWPRSQRMVPVLQRVTYPFAAGIAANSEDVAVEMVSERRARAGSVMVLPNPVDIDAVRAAAAANPKARDEGRFVFCAVGRLAWQKGYDLMLRGFARARANLPSNWELRVLGQGPRAEEIFAETRRLGLEERVSFLGHGDPYPVMASADVFVHTARWEGSPVVLKEALALELPIVATAGLGAQREILDGGRYGLLVASDDPSAIGRGLVSMASDPELRARFSASALEGARRYSGRVVAERMCVLADEVQARRN